MDFEKDLSELEVRIKELKTSKASEKVDLSAEIEKLEAKAQELRNKVYAELSAWQKFQLMRHPDRPHTLDYVDTLLEDWMEIHGDRNYGDDKAMICGFGKLDGMPLGVVGIQKGRDTKENVYRNFGMAQPEGYRKALRFMQLCARFGLPILSLVDTAGAYPGIEGEERSVAEAIAKNLFEMSHLPVPIVVVVIGEGGSGGALGIGVGDRVLMQANAFYSVISPEACATILWRDRSRAEEAATALKGSADQLLRFGIIDEIIPEPIGGAHQDPVAATASLKEAIKRHFNELKDMDPKARIDTRYQKFRAMGEWTPMAAVGKVGSE